MVRYLWFCVAAALAVLPACKGEHGSADASEAAPAPSMPASAASTQDVPAPIPDAQLLSGLTDALARDPVLRSQPVHVSVAEGAVTLTGMVRTLAARWRANRLVADFKGVVGVTDAILVKASPRNDTEITRDVGEAIAGDPATRNARVKASVSGGIVSLSGAVDSYAQRDLVADATSSVPGVQAVNLAVTIARLSPRSDAEIATDVIEEMRDDARLHGTPLEAAVHARSVVLSGVVGSLAQRNAAVEDAWNAGAAGVDAQAVRIDWLENVNGRPLVALPVPSDAEIAKAVSRVLSSDARVGAQLPSVHVEHGVVTLSGNVTDFRAQRAAYRDARRVSGMQRVENDTTVLPARRESDATIERQVLQSIYDDVAAPDSRDVQAKTLNAKVTLSGAVASEEDKKVIEDDVEEVPGVVAVEDDLRVPGYIPQTQLVAPEVIRRRVTEAIFWDPRVPPGKIAVSVDPRGNVTLIGHVDSWGDKQAAVDDATRAGAAHVNDDLQIANAK